MEDRQVTHVLAIDQGTSGTKAVVVSDDAVRSSLEALCVLDDGGIATSTSTGSLVVRDLVGAARSF
jgi:sugar (pentulose or hexulose) kinase